MPNHRVHILSLLAVAMTGVMIIAWMMVTLESVDPTKATIILPDDTLVVADVARTIPDKVRGLSGRDMLGEREGMLFVYENEEIQTFWMKGMLIDIDIIWLNQGKIIGIEHSVPAPKNEEIERRSSQEPVDMVLEVNAGFSSSYGLEPGDNLDIFWGK